MPLMIEARPYGPDSTPEELEALRARVTLHSKGVLVYREVPVMSPFQVELLFDRLDELLLEHGCSFVIFDVSETGRPDARARARIKARISQLEGRVPQVAVVTAKNTLVNVAARFVASGLAVTMTVHETFAEAERAIRRAAK